MKNCSNAGNVMISTACGSSILAVSLGFSAVGSLILGCAIGYYFYRSEKAKEQED